MEQASRPTPLEDADEKLQTRVLPVLALNEVIAFSDLLFVVQTRLKGYLINEWFPQVFIGECISARVSYLEIKFDDDDPVKEKCSGLIVSTGTGSTSWTYNVNKLTEQSLEKVGTCFVHSVLF